MRGLRIFLIGSIMFSLLCFYGFIWAYEDQQTAHNSVPAVTTPQALNTKGDMKIVALGDSLTHGYGDSNGKGYVGDVVDQLRSQTHSKITTSNLAINGQTSGQLLKQVGQQEVIRQIEQADVIMMSIGGNDLNQQGRTLNDLDQSNIGGLISTYKSNLSSILQQIRSLNDHARIYFIGLYNPYLDATNAKVTSKIVRQWNNETTDLISNDPNIVFVPTFDLFQLHQEQYLFGDHFHPNSKGYHRIAERITPLLTP